MEAIIYVGKWELLPKEVEGINGLYNKPQWWIREEVVREISGWSKQHPYEETLIGPYSLESFEETFNGDDEASLNGATYWMKIFINGKSVLTD